MTKKTNFITPPSTISFLVGAIKCNDNPAAAQLLIKSAIAAVYEKPEAQVTKEEVEAVVGLIQTLEPKDTIEAMLAAQIICAHIQGMNSMSKNYLNSKGHGLMLLRLSHQSLEQLQRYRGKLSQNINVTYNTLIKGVAS
ncbi:MAG: hypothetical protein NTX86_02335 [Candidatus Dependentiae bacterium]|nr:hypothetical protein [Candidatus Dependentiae bacterium]